MPSAKPTSGPALYGIIGHPLQRTWSPDIHNAAFHVCGLPCHYAPFAVPPARLKQGVAALAALKVSGFNVTVPHKETILPLLRTTSPLVRELGAANTVLRRPRGWHGENTDVHGFVAPLLRYRRSLAGQAAVVIGAGGAARAVVYALVRHFKMTGVLVLARRRSRAESLASWAQGLSPFTAVSALELKKVRDWRAAFGHAALVVQATPAGGPGRESARVLPAGVRFHGGQIAYDLAYTGSTDFLKRARKGGAVTLDGKEMLLQQAAAAFGLFTGKSFPEHAVLSELKRSGLWLRP